MEKSIELRARRSRWELYPSLSEADVARAQAALPHLKLSPLLVQLLANRGLREPDEIECFLRPPDVSAQPDPLLMTGMRAAVERICKAIDGHQKVVVYGDFDADGVTSTALLTMSLRHFGAEAEPYVPHRIAEGYGLNLNALREVAAGGAKLVVTVDCGISNRAEAIEAKKLGLDLIVTDHHHLPSELPDVICINPKQRVEGCEDFEDLAGVGVAYQLVRALVKRCGKPKNLRNKDLLGLVAIGTVADVAPLKGANRSLVQQGLAALPQHSMPGLRTMLDYAHISFDGMDTERIGFVIGPRLNAAGRIDDARSAYRLLMTEDVREAHELAQKLEAQNRRRQALMSAMTEQARELTRQMPDDVELILLHNENWVGDAGNPLGVVGLVAGKLVEEFGRPALVLAPSPTEGESRGSARSTPDFDIHSALTQVKHLLVQFGGHSAAAGLTVKNENIAELNRRLCEIARSRVPDGETEARPVIMADREISLSEITEATMRSIDELAPFGAGNPSPLFLARGLQVVDMQTLGDSAHLKLWLADRGSPSRSPLEAIAFRMANFARIIKKDSRLDLLFYIERHRWKGNVSLQMRVREIRLSMDG